MKFMIGVDCEGPACVVGHPNEGLSNSPNFAFARLQATREADAAAKGLFDAGASQVVVWDNHGTGVNLDYDQLDRRCEIALGSGFERRFPGLDDTFAGVLFVGYHAMDNTHDAVLAHTYSSITYQFIKLQDQPVGEMAIDAAYAGRAGVPPILAVGDDKMTREAEQFFPGIATVTTKRAMGHNGAISKHPLAVLEEIRAAAAHAVERRAYPKPFAFTEPMDAEIRYKRIEAAQGHARRRQWTRLDAYTVRGTIEQVEDLFR